MSADHIAAEGARSRPPHERGSLVPSPAVSMVSIGAEDHHDPPPILPEAGPVPAQEGLGPDAMVGVAQKVAKRSILGARRSAYPAGPAGILHRPDPIMIVAEPSFVVELAYIKFPF
jgi:hypothetical protein